MEDLPLSAMILAPALVDHFDNNLSSEVRAAACSWVLNSARRHPTAEAILTPMRIERPVLLGE
ncbi:hypothetical protein LB505_002788 [Fusarium chuoi]|nr:hypothetical protein LB505_002788 [Fusarium chuoi]